MLLLLLLLLSQLQLQFIEASNMKKANRAKLHFWHAIIATHRVYETTTALHYYSSKTNSDEFGIDKFYARRNALTRTHTFVLARVYICVSLKNSISLA